MDELPRRAGNLVLPLALLTLLAGSAASDPLGATGVIVESVGPAATGPLRAGDELLAWRVQGPEGSPSGVFASWIDAELLQLDGTAHGPVEVEILRGGERRSVTLPPVELRLEARPRFSPETLGTVEQILAEDAEADGDAAFGRLRRVVGSTAPDAEAWALTTLAEARRDRGDVAGAVRAWEAAAAVAPARFAGELIRRAGSLAMDVDQLEEASRLARSAEAAWERVDPGGLGTSMTLHLLGSVEGRRQHLDRAREWMERACELRERKAPRSWLHAGCLNGLGVLAGRANDLGLAEARFLEALEISRALGDPGRSMVGNLGIVARLRGDVERSILYGEQALELSRREGDPLAVADRLTNLGNALNDAGRHREAAERLSSALAIYRERSPSSPVVVVCLFNRAKARRESGDLEGAASDLEEAAGRADLDDPRLPVEASILSLQGELALLRGDLDRALERSTRGLDAQTSFRPDSLHEARAAARVALVHAARGDDEAADAHFRRALRALELQQERIGGGDRGLVSFRTKFAEIYRDYQEFLVDRGRADEAYEIFEESRARGLRALLAGREVEWSSPELSRLAPERRRLAQEIEASYGRFVQLPPGEEESREKLRGQIAALHAERDRVTTRMASTSSRFAALRVPRALRLAEIRRALDPSVLVLAYSVGNGGSILYAIDRASPVAAHRIPVGSADLEDRVDRWLEALRGARGGAESAARGALLAETLLGPVDGRVRRAGRIVLLPDGPLHRLPFGALPLPGPRGPGPLLEIAPIQRAASLSVHLSPPPPRSDVSDRVLAVGDPVASSEAMARYRDRLGSLPASREEALLVGRHFGDRARVLLGAEATEEAAVRELPRAEIAHFASHAVVDEVLPMDSALVLSPGPSGSGLLQAWEIVENLELDAGLIVLSACRTARGREEPGEGIVGLVRALRIAGARGVLASLWNVADASTAELMDRFYVHLGRGVGADDALRRAQLDLIRGTHGSELDLSHPRNWAAFVVHGRAE